MKIAIVGPSGSGKTISMMPVSLPKQGINIKGLDPKITFFISCGDRVPPIQGFNTQYPTLDFTKKDTTGKTISAFEQIKSGSRFIRTQDSATIVALLENITKNFPDITNLIIDDAQYIQGFAVIDRAKEKGYEKWTEIGKLLGDVLIAAGRAPVTTNIIFTFHDELQKDNTYKIKTAGALVDQALNIAGLMDIMLYTDIEKTETSVNYRFATQSDGVRPAKSPLGMFNDFFIPNDMGYVTDCIRAFYK